MRNRQRVAQCLAVLALLAVSRPVSAADAVIVDPSGDAQPDACGTIAWSCQWFGGESQPAADIRAVQVVPAAGTFGLEVTYSDIDRPIPGLGSDNRVRDNVSFRLGDRLARHYPSVEVSAFRDFNGNLTSSSVEFNVSGKDGALSSVPGVVTIDRATNRLRFSASTSQLARAIQETCPGCAPLSRGAVLWSFFAHSQALSGVQAAGTGVGVQVVANDTAWPGEGSYTVS